MVALTRERASATLIPPLFSLMINQLVAIYFYRSLHSAVLAFALWMIMSAFGNVLIGYLSDKHCRRQVLILTQFLGLIALFLYVFVMPGSLWPLVMLGLFYNPSAVARAGIIDNFPRVSKVKLVAASFIVEMVPWTFYSMLSTVEIERLGWIGFVFLLLNILLTILFFEDHRDEIEGHQPSLSKVVHQKHRKQFFFTLWATFPVQIGFYLTDTVIERYPHNADLYSVWGLGSLLAACLTYLYKKTPHISFLTVAYGIGFLFSVSHLLCQFFFQGHNYNPAYQIIFFSCIIGFYIPFVFDVILNACSVDFRGMVCGIIEFVFTIASLIGVILIDVVNIGIATVVLIIPALAFTSIVLQKRAE